jgi:hypothetical protein
MTTKLERFATYIAQRREWPMQQLPEQGVLRAAIDLGWARWSLEVVAPESMLAVSVRSRYPDPVPAERRAVAMEYLTRANLNVEVGAFQLDLDDGTVAFRTGLWVKDHGLDEAIIANLIDTNMFGYAAYVRGLEAVIAGSATVEDAILEAEGRG